MSYPALLLVRPTMRNSVLTLQHSDMEILNVDLSEVALKPIHTSNVGGIEVPVHDSGFDASEWLSRLLDNSVDNIRLVLYASNNSRKLKIPANKVYKFRKTDTGALPDELPFHLMNEASIDDLNTKLQGNKVCYKNFRPNFLITGARPYEEDDWKYVKIGENMFEVINPCTRCMMTTIDPETGIRDSKAEPIQTLKSYRQITEPSARPWSGSAPRMGVPTPGAQVQEWRPCLGQ